MASALAIGTGIAVAAFLVRFYRTNHHHRRRRRRLPWRLSTTTSPYPNLTY